MPWRRAVASLFLVVLAAMASVCPAAEIPEFTGLVVDQAGALSEDERDALFKRLAAIQRSGRAQLALLVVKDTGGAPLSDYALRVAESWKVGRAGRDDGLLILVVPSPAGARLEVGYGLEGPIPDARASKWIDELLPAIREKRIAEGLDRLLDEIDAALPVVEVKQQKDIFDEHPEWKLTFALTVFSLFSVFPLFMSRWGSIPSAFILAAFAAGVGWSLRELRTDAIVAAAAAFPLPLTWGLNHVNTRSLRPWLRWAKHFGNLMGVLLFFTILSVFVGGGLFMSGAMVWWAGLFFSGLLSIGLAVFLFPGKPAEYLLLLLRSAVQFVFILALAFVAMTPFTPDPSRLAFTIAGVVTAFTAIGLYLGSREQLGYRWRGRRLSLAFYALALLAALPFALLALFLAVGGEDAHTQLVQAAAGGGSIAVILGIAARVGLIAVVKVGLGGLFGGGGAGRSD
jgi:uncharacterized protein